MSDDDLKARAEAAARKFQEDERIVLYAMKDVSARILLAEAMAEFAASERAAGQREERKALRAELQKRIHWRNSSTINNTEAGVRQHLSIIAALQAVAAWLDERDGEKEAKK